MMSSKDLPFWVCWLLILILLALVIQGDCKQLQISPIYINAGKGERREGRSSLMGKSFLESLWYTLYLLIWLNWVANARVSISREEWSNHPSRLGTFTSQTKSVHGASKKQWVWIGSQKYHVLLNVLMATIHRTP